MSTPQPPVFTGTTAECLAHFAEQTSLASPSRSKNALRAELADLLDVASPTIKRWCAGPIQTTKPNLVKLETVLAGAGYQVTDPVWLNLSIPEWAKYVALGALSVGDVAKRTGVAESTVVRWLGGGVGMLPQPTLKALDSIVQEKDTVYQDKASKLLDILHRLGCDVRAPATKHVPSTAGRRDAVSLVPEESVGEVAATTAAFLISLLLPSMATLLSDKCSAAHRARLRELTANGHSNGVFEASNMLSQLCSEQARRDIRRKTQDTDTRQERVC